MTFTKTPYRLLIRITLAALVFSRVDGNAEEAALPTVVESYQAHQIQLLDTPALALDRMLRAISSAESEVVLEYNGVLVCHWVSLVLFNAIQKRATALQARGKTLRVRLLVDYSQYYDSTPDLTEAGFAGIVSAFRRQGIELKIFSPPRPFDIFHPLHLFRLNIRDHQKRLIVDGKEIVMGGRLIENQYYGLKADFDRFEKDIWISGPVVRDIQIYFDRLWLNELSNDQFQTKAPLTEVDRKEIAATEECLQSRNIHSKDLDWLHDAARAEAVFRPELKAEHLVIGFDYPGFASKAASFIPYFYELLGKTKKHLLAEEQYFLPTSALAEVWSQLTRREVSVEILTNSFASGDDSLLDYLTLLRANAYSQSPNMRIHLFKGKVPGDHFGLWRPEVNKARWQIHSKALVMDDRSSWVGSNNFDSRSERFNLETGVLVVDQPAFAKQLSDSIQANLRESVLALPDNPSVGPFTEDLKALPFLKRIGVRAQRLGYRLVEIFL
jgi:cardiolipin synthase C